VSRLRASLLLLLGIGCAAPEPDTLALDTTPVPEVTSTPLFQSGLWPGEGIPVFEATGAPIILRDRPDPAAPARDTIAPTLGTRLGFDSTAVVTWVGSPLVALRDVVISGRNLGPERSISPTRYYDGTAPTVQQTVDSGSTITLLQYRAEGGCFVLVGSNVIEAEQCPTMMDPPAFKVEREPAVYWWAWIVSGEQAGWAEVEDKAIAVVDREF